MRRNSFNTSSNPAREIGIFKGSVVSVGEDGLLRLKIPKLGLNNIYEGIPYAGPTPAAGDVVFVGFLEGKSGSFVAFTGVVGAGNTGDPAGDITSVTAGVGISGGGSSGDVTVDFEPSELTTVTLAYDDKVVISDDSDSGEPKLVPISEVITTANGDGGEPIGHEDKSESVISFDYSTRTFTISPVGDSYVVWCAGQKFVKTASESVVIGSSSDLYYISFDADGVLQATTTYFQWDSETPTAYIHYNSGEPAKYMLFDERHGIVLDWQTHEYLHRTRGAAIASGFDASNFDVSTQNGSTDDQAYIDIANGTFFDEDLQVDIVHSNTPTANTWEQDLQGPAQIPVFYQSGTTGWTYDAPTNFPLKYGGTPSPTYNLNSGGTWSTPEITSNNYGISWIVATNQLNYPVIAIMGQDFYTNVGDAEAVTWDSMDLTDLPVVELRVLYKVIYRQFGSNTPGAYFVEVDDYRRALSSATSTAAAVVDHGHLTGLGDDDHTQYLLVDCSRTATSLTTSGTVTVGAFTLPATDGSADQVLVTDGSGSVTWQDSGETTPGGSDGLVQYNNGGVFGGASSLYYDDVNNRVGINDSTPSYTLDVNGTGRFTGALDADTQINLGSALHLTQADVDGSMRVQGNTGYIDIGPKSATYCNIDTDRGSFYFNKDTLYANGNKIWHAGNDGPGSGLDADTLDGVQASSFLRSDATDSASGTLTFSTASATYFTSTYLTVGASLNTGRRLYVYGGTLASELRRETTSGSSGILALSATGGANKFIFYADGDAAKSTGAGDWQGISDDRLKTKLTSLSVDDMLTRLMALDPTMYEHTHTVNLVSDGNGDDDLEIVELAEPASPLAGFMASDFETQFPDLVVTKGTQNIKHLPIGQWDAILTAGLQASVRRIEALEERIAALEAQ